MIAHSGSQQDEEEQAGSSQQGILLQRHRSWCGLGDTVHIMRSPSTDPNPKAAESKGHGLKGLAEKQIKSLDGNPGGL